MRGIDLAILRLPAFRTHWLAGLCFSLGVEIEMIIYLWYVYAQTRSPFYLSLLAALPYLGTLGSPMVGLLGDRLGHKRILVTVRLLCFALSCILTLALLAGYLSPMLVIAVFCLAGLLRPADQPLRSAMLVDIVPLDRLLSAGSLSRITIDLSRLFGAMAGGALVVVLGMPWAAGLASLTYGLSVVFTRRIPAEAPASLAGEGERRHPFRDVLAAAQLAANTPPQAAAMSLAFLVNLFTYPFIIGLVPYIVANTYDGGQAELSYLTAAMAMGFIFSALVMGLVEGRISLGRAMCAGAILWGCATPLLLTSHGLTAGIALYGLFGFLNGMCVLPMAALQMLSAPRAMRGRLLGLRSFAVYGLFIGLMLASVLIERMGFAFTVVIFSMGATVGSITILIRWNRYY